MKLQSITLTALLMLLVACGTERPNPDDYFQKGTSNPATGTKPNSTKTADASKTPTSNTTTPAANTAPTADAAKPATATPPPATPAATPARIVPNAAELAAATAYYNATCAGCHMPLAGPSAKKGLTPARLITGKTAAAHVNLKVDVTKWPEKDVTTNDGVENENLVATAFLQILK